jgi:DNA invertase Pin-like site-specific DNA recombinase
MGDLLGYARVSTTDQNPQCQTDALTAAGCFKLFVDHASGSIERRVELDRLLEQLRPGDTLVVWRLDRLGRSLRHLIDLVTELDRRGVGFRSLTESIDTTTSAGKLVFHVFGALAEFERSIIAERTNAGLASARARGRKGGRPAVMTPDKLAAAKRLYEGRDHTVEQIAAMLGVSRTTIYRGLHAGDAMQHQSNSAALSSPAPASGSRDGRRAPARSGARKE